MAKRKKTLIPCINTTLLSYCINCTTTLVNLTVPNWPNFRVRVNISSPDGAFLQHLLNLFNMQLQIPVTKVNETVTAL